MTYIDPIITIAAGTVAKNSGATAGKCSERKEKSSSDIQFGGEYKKIIDKALQDNPDKDPELVQKTRELLLNGQFDTPEAARQAAQKIIDYGI